MPKPKRSEFLTKQDFEEACALVRLARLAMKHGATADECVQAIGSPHWLHTHLPRYLSERSNAPTK